MDEEARGLMGENEEAGGGASENEGVGGFACANDRTKGPTVFHNFPCIMVVACIALLNWSTYLVPMFYVPTLFNIKFSKDDIHDVNIRALEFSLVVKYRNIVKFQLRIARFYL
jgi:hypothetical protein